MHLELVRDKIGRLLELFNRLPAQQGNVPSIRFFKFHRYFSF